MKLQAFKDNLMDLVHVDDQGCWRWRAGKDQDGYGRVDIYESPLGKCRSHRVSYEIFKGPIPPGLTVDHMCFVRSCINPDHLRLLTRRENFMNRKPHKYRTHCINGHEMTPDNSYNLPGKDTRAKICRACNSAASRRRNERIKAQKQASEGGA